MALWFNRTDKPTDNRTDNRADNSALNLEPESLVDEFGAASCPSNFLLLKVRLESWHGFV